MDKITIVLWVLAIGTTIFQYIAGYLKWSRCQWICPVLFSIFMLWFYFNGKDVSLISAVTAFIIGNIWYMAYAEMGKRKRN
ncbi:hypothetical protein C1S45_06305 [Lactiplantibacillus plantarum]|uniref:Prophage P3 protein 13 n=1 Tax=Lactiplantibacillus plantarum (strain ATCC BAA-793 / NCIMB 8826 / WCFS1) TaxID=220668 RepID=F9UU60_LACPL|nr:hypothetical protein [Lactiplantibacillus plantarum]CCC80362.1 prophage P3 protein 13 [Lactiplantibacillus plantarum WCFS1]MDE4416719.1 hypothetical protein [Lactiplantibacillus plantarum]MDE4421562.1 hypothetical protein [Lactiplantibacillus plantarum]MDE4425593.1 hypothetical protein [Lactiplantibacillus plantarum]